jgi:hypothetical protein
VKLDIEDLVLQGDPWTSDGGMVGGVPVGEFRWRVKHRLTGLTLEATHPDDQMDRGPWVLAQLVVDLAGRLAEMPPPVTKTHLPGQAVTIGGRWVRQRCQFCGQALIEEDLERVAVPVGQEGAGRREFNPGRFVRVTGGFPTIYEDAGPAAEESRPPGDMCWLDVPEIAARRAEEDAVEGVAEMLRKAADDRGLNEVPPAAESEAEQMQRGEKHRRLWSECKQETFTPPGADNPVMTLEHMPTGVKASGIQWTTEVETRLRLIERLADKVKRHVTQQRADGEWFALQERRAGLLKDCQVDVYTGAGSSVRIVHKPTGLVVSGPVDGTELETRGRLLDELGEKLKTRGAELAAFLAECEVNTFLTDDTPHSMQITHERTGLSSTSTLYRGEVATREALLVQLRDKVRAHDAAHAEEEPGYRPAPDAEELEQAEDPADAVQEWSTADPPEDARPDDDEVFTPSPPNPETQEPPEATHG